MQEIDALDLEFEKIKRIREIVRAFRPRLEGMEATLR